MSPIKAPSDALMDWLKARASAAEWDQIQSLKKAGEKSVLAYVERVAPAAYQALLAEGLVREPSSLTINKGGVPLPDTDEIVGWVQGKGGWSNAELTAAERAEAARKAEIESTGMVPIEEADVPGEAEIHKTGWFL